MNKNTLYDLKEMLCKELDEIAKKGEMSAGDLETVHKLTDTVKNIEKIMYIDDNGYSMDGDWRVSGTYARDGMRMDDRGMSYANRGRHYVRGHYSRGDGREMSRCRDYLSDQIRDMMDRDDLSQTDRASLKRALEELQG
nr:MAG TPA: hypothetical protein [Caudoviricetes sp.]